jgi:membrane-bound lytic murein transglycosylase D
MMYLLRVLIVLSFTFGFVNCSLTDRFRSNDSPGIERNEVLANVQLHANATLDYFQQGDYQKAKEELVLAKGLLTRLGLQTDSEKIDYLDRNFAPHGMALSFAIIEEELAKIVGAGQTSSAGANQPNTEIASYSAPGSLTVNSAPVEEAVSTSEETGDAAPAADDATAYENVFRADVKSIKPDYGGKGYFERDLHNFIQKEIREVAIHMGEPSNFKLPDDFVREIEHYIRRFQNEEKYREFFERTLRRSRKYLPVLSGYFTEKGFPEEIIYLAFIESGFNPAARSRSNAVGMFQFIKSTGRNYGLKINRWHDERYSPIKSAIACREYMHDLVLELGSFTLALSSYNSGPGKTRQALRKLDDFKDRSFWALREKTNVLKHETREYVPQIFAAIVMTQPDHPPKFGFQDVPFPDASRYRTVIVAKQLSLRNIANAGNISVKEILALNPDLEPNATYTPSKVIDYPLFVPRGSEGRISSYVNSYFKQKKPTAKSKSPASSKPVASYDGGRDSGSGIVYTDRSGNSHSSSGSNNSSSGGSDNNSKSHIQYQVQVGNTLTQIADWFGTSASQLAAWNPHLSSRGLQIGDIVYIKETDHYWSKTAHKIRPGETLSTIASKYRVSMDDLRGWNGISGSTIIAGNTLVVYMRQGEAGKASASRSASAPGQTINNDSGILVRQSIGRGETFLYRVASGNTLSDIANLFAVSVSQIKSWNGLSTNQIYPGQKLKIVSARNMKFYKYRVQGGDDLGDVASRFGASVETIKTVNGKSGGYLQKGEILSIFSI